MLTWSLEEAAIFFLSNRIASMIIMHGNGIILSWTSCTTCMTSFYDFISLQTPDCRLFFSLTELWLDWLSGLAADDGDDSMAQRQTTQTTDVIRCDVSTDVSSSSSSWDLLVIDVIVPNCGASKWFTYRSLHSLMNLMQLWHSWQLTLANGIMDNHGIDSTWQWIDSWKLEVGNWKQMPSWHHDIILHCVDLPQWYWLGTRDWDSGFGISSYS